MVSKHSVLILTDTLVLPLVALEILAATQSYPESWDIFYPLLSYLVYPPSVSDSSFPLANFTEEDFASAELFLQNIEADESFGPFQGFQGNRRF